jgi:hypothetical protein
MPAKARITRQALLKRPPQARRCNRAEAELVVCTSGCSNRESGHAAGQDSAGRETANALNEENARLRDELGRYKAAIAETEEEERHRRWGAEILAGIDAAGGRAVRI